MLTIAFLALLLTSAESGATESAGEAANRQAATRDAEDRLTVLQLPPGAYATGGPPAGANPELTGQPGGPTGPNLVDLTAWWVVPGTPPEAIEWIRSHLPAESSVGSEVFGGNSKTGSEYRGVELVWPPLGESVAYRGLRIGVAARTAGDTALRVDAQAIWISPHEAAERIPPRARLLEVEWSRPGKPSRSVTTENARFVKALAKLVDRLPIVQPGIYHCPMETVDRTTVELRFLGRPHGPPLAEAVQGLPPDGPCGAMTLTIRGKREPALEGADPVIRRLRKLR